VRSPSASALSREEKEEAPIQGGQGFLGSFGGTVIGRGELQSRRRYSEPSDNLKLYFLIGGIRGAYRTSRGSRRYDERDFLRLGLAKLFVSMAETVAPADVSTGTIHSSVSADDSPASDFLWALSETCASLP